MAEANFISETEVKKLATALKESYIKKFDSVRFLPWDKKDCLPLSDVYVRLIYERGHLYGWYPEQRLKNYTDLWFVSSEQKQEKKWQPIKFLQRHLKIGKSTFSEKGEGDQKQKKTESLRILVQGDPGVGKSTFSKKVCLDWARNAEPDLKQFKVVATIFLRTLMPEETIEDNLYRELLPHNRSLTPERIREVMTYLKQKCLLILDGLDELTIKMSDIDNIIERKTLADATVVITTRPVGSDAIRHSNVTAKILGFEPKGVDKYIQRFFRTVKRADLHQQCMDAIRKKGFEAMSQVPLLLHLLCILFHNFGNLPDTLTGVYKQIKDYVIKRYKSVKSEIGKTLDEQEFQDSLHNIRMLAYRGLITGDLIFSEDEIEMTLSKYMLEIGFLANWDIPKTKKKKVPTATLR